MPANLPFFGLAEAVREAVFVKDRNEINDGLIAASNTYQPVLLRQIAVDLDPVLSLASGAA